MVGIFRDDEPADCHGGPIRDDWWIDSVCPWCGTGT